MKNKIKFDTLTIGRSSVATDHPLIKEFIENVRTPAFYKMYGQTHHAEGIDKFDRQNGTTFVIATLNGSVIGGQRLILKQHGQDQILPVEEMRGLGYLSDFIRSKVIHGETVMERSGIAVSPNAQGIGLGKAIVSRGNEWICKMFPRHLQVVENAPASVKLYSLGTGAEFYEFDSVTTHECVPPVTLRVRASCPDNFDIAYLRCLANQQEECGKPEESFVERIGSESREFTHTEKRHFNLSAQDNPVMEGGVGKSPGIGGRY